MTRHGEPAARHGGPTAVRGLKSLFRGDDGFGNVEILRPQSWTQDFGSGLGRPLAPKFVMLSAMAGKQIVIFTQQG